MKEFFKTFYVIKGTISFSDLWYEILKDQKSSIEFVTYVPFCKYTNNMSLRVQTLDNYFT